RRGRERQQRWRALRRQATDVRPDERARGVAKLGERANASLRFAERSPLVAAEQPLSVLVVDDDPELRPLVAFALRQGGFAVQEAATGEEALAAFAVETPDLVVLDVNLPGIDGFEVCRRLREQSAVPVLMLTVRGEEEDLVQGL